MIRSEAATRNRSRVAYLVAFVILGVAPLDFLLADGFPGESLAVRLVWALGMLMLAHFTPRVSAPARDRLLAAIAAFSVLCWLALTVLLGGSGSPYFWWMLALPLIFGALAPDNLMATAAAGLGTLAGNLILLIHEGASASAMVLWLVIAGVSIGLSAFGVLNYRRLLEAETALEASHARAAQELAISEQRRIHAEKLALIGKLAAGIAHEINNPLAYVKANLDLLRTGGAIAPQELEALLEESREGIARIEQIVADMRSFARADDGSFEPCNLASVVAEATRVASLRTRRVATVHVDVPPDLPPVSGSRIRLVQIFVNLLVNAADALAQRRSPRWIRIDASYHDGRVRVQVSDNGGGIPEDVLAHLFEPFVTNKPGGKGLGLGLNLVREFVVAFGGTIEARNVPDAGACFSIELPVAVQAHAA